MGQPIVVTEKPSAANRGVVRFETSRMLTGTGHERYRRGDEIFGERPPDELARRLLELDAVAGVHVHGNMITVDLNRGYEADGVRAIIEDLYVFYPDNLVNPSDEASEAEDADAGAPPEADAGEAAETAPEAEAATADAAEAADEVPEAEDAEASDAADADAASDGGDAEPTD